MPDTEQIAHPATLVCVPTIGGSRYWPDLLAKLLHDPGVTRLLVVDDSEEGLGIDQTLRTVQERHLPSLKLEVRAAAERGIYRTWNVAMEMARAAHADFVCALNDDLEIDAYPPLIARMAEAMTTHSLHLASPHYGGDVHSPGAEVHLFDGSRSPGTWRNDGIAGFAWMARAAVAARVDERFGWWGGDDDLVNTMHAEGYRIGQVQSVAVRHHPSTTANASPWITDEVIAADRELLLSKWGEAW